MGLLGLHRAQG